MPKKKKFGITLEGMTYEDYAIGSLQGRPLNNKVSEHAIYLHGEFYGFRDIDYIMHHFKISWDDAVKNTIRINNEKRSNGNTVK